MRDTKLYQQVLGLTEPWSVSEVVLQVDEKRGQKDGISLISLFPLRCAVEDELTWQTPNSLMLTFSY